MTMFKGTSGVLRNGLIPFGADEPRYTAAGGQTLRLSYPFDAVVTRDDIYTINGGPFARNGIEQQTLEVGTGVVIGSSGYGGKCLRFDWDAQPEQFSLITYGPGFPARSREICQVWYRTQGIGSGETAFEYFIGKKWVLFDNASNTRLTVNPSVFSMTQTVGVKLDTDGSGPYGGGLWDFYPHGGTEPGSIDGALGSINDGYWHRYTIARRPETTPGTTLDGTIDIWWDGYHVAKRPNVDGLPLGTGSVTQVIEFMSTFNGGAPSPWPEWDACDHITIWNEAA